MQRIDPHSVTDALCNGRCLFDDFKYFAIYEYFVHFLLVFPHRLEASVALKQPIPLTTSTKQQYVWNTIYPQKCTYNTNKYVQHAAEFCC